MVAFLALSMVIPVLIVLARVFLQASLFLAVSLVGSIVGIA